MSDTEENDCSSETQEFNFEEWTNALKLSRKVCQTLRVEELTSKETIALLNEGDLNEEHGTITQQCKTNNKGN